MLSLADLWLPILISAIAVFFISMIFWTVSPHHKADIKPLDRDTESKFMDLVKSAGVKPGAYMFPHCGGDRKYEKSDEFKAKWESGCMGNLCIYSGKYNIGRNMALSFVSNLLVSFFVAYLLTQAIIPGEGGTAVMRFAGAAAIGFYGLGCLMGGIWFGQPARAFVTDSFDAIVYGVATGLIFMFFWPGVEAAASGAVQMP